VTVFETDDPICALTRSETTEDKEEDMEKLEESLVHGDWGIWEEAKSGSMFELVYGGRCWRGAAPALQRMNMTNIFNY